MEDLLPFSQEDVGECWNKIDFNSLLLSRLQIPAPCGLLIPRPRLLNLLNEGNCKLTLVTAPAGYGKTTAIAEWLRHEETATAWVSLEAEDNDPEIFWRDVYIAILKTASERENDGESCVLDKMVRKSGRPYFEKVIDFLVSDNIRAKFPQGLVLVVDDYHMIKTLSIHKEMERLFTYITVNVQVVLVSRTCPKLSVNKLRIKGFLRELTVENLKFGQDEIRDYFMAHNILLSGEDLQRAEARSQGWVLALYCALLTAKEHKDSSSVSGIDGANRYLRDFFADEVMSQYSQSLQNFLKEVSFLPTFSSSLCEAATGVTNCWMLLNTLEKSHSFMFFTALEHEEQWFELHPLFAQYLQAHSDKNLLLQKANISRKAGFWCEKNNRPADAISYYIVAEDNAEALRMMEQEGPNILRKSEGYRYLDWAGCLPEEEAKRHLIHCLTLAYIFLESDRLDECKQWINYAEKLDEEKNTGELDFLKGNVAIREKKGAEAAKFIEQSYKKNKLDLFPEGIIGINNGEASLLLTSFGFYGYLHEFSAFSGSIDPQIKKLFGSKSGYIWVAMAEAYYEQNRLDEGIHYLEMGMEEGKQACNPEILIPAVFMLNSLKKALAHEDKIPEIVGEMGYIWRSAEGVQWKHLFEAFKVRLGIERGELGAGERWVFERKLSLGASIEAFREYELITYVRLLKAQQCYEDALFLLARLAIFSERNGRLPSLIEIYNLTALIYQEKGEQGKAVEALHKSLVLGERHGYMRHYIDEGVRMATLLGKYCRNYGKKIFEDKEKLKRYARKLEKMTRDEVIRKISHNRFDKVLVSHNSTKAMTVQLTRREQEVFRLIAKEMTNAEIAEALGVSCQTVKIHASSTYGKLGVKNRLQAIRRGKELNIIS